jgi:hypothetical protein
MPGNGVTETQQTDEHRRPRRRQHGPLEQLDCPFMLREPSMRERHRPRRQREVRVQFERAFTQADRVAVSTGDVQRQRSERVNERRKRVESGRFDDMQNAFIEPVARCQEEAKVNVSDRGARLDLERSAKVGFRRRTRRS